MSGVVRGWLEQLGVVQPEREEAPAPQRPSPGSTSTAAGLRRAPSRPADRVVEDLVRTRLNAHAGTTNYTIRSGDSFGRIADRRGIHVTYIERLNPGVSSARLRAGQVIRVPSSAGVESLAFTRIDMGDVPDLVRYPPGSDEWVALFTRAAELARVPTFMSNTANRQALVRIMSGARGVPGENPQGYVFQPNGLYGARSRPENRSQWSDIRNELRRGDIEGQDNIRARRRSSATGLGQMILPNMDQYAPGGRTSMGDPLGEAIAMLRYIEDRYGTPTAAWAEKQRTHVY